MIYQLPYKHGEEGQGRWRKGGCVVLYRKTLTFSLTREKYKLNEASVDIVVGKNAVI